MQKNANVIRRTIFFIEISRKFQQKINIFKHFPERMKTLSCATIFVLVNLFAFYLHSLKQYAARSCRKNKNIFMFPLNLVRLVSATYKTDSRFKSFHKLYLFRKKLDRYFMIILHGKSSKYTTDILHWRINDEGNKERKPFMMNKTFHSNQSQSCLWMENSTDFFIWFIS